MIMTTNIDDKCIPKSVITHKEHRGVSASFSNELLVNFGFNNNEIKIIKDICSTENIKPLSLFRQALREWQFKHTDIEPVESKGCMGD